MTTTPPDRKSRKGLWIGGSIFAVLVLIIVGSSLSESPEPAPAASPTLTAPFEVPGTAPVPAPPEPVSDPLTDDGHWLVPQEIKPGTYRATQDGLIGYMSVCSNMKCNVMDGMIDNYGFMGRGETKIVVIPADAVKVELQGLELRPL